ncbi:MAG: LysM peptidoglycan-binding domain-containing protein [Desulfuromonadaceae bacterium]|nr:LysM peptidoglycan-binding domain-containing protein [Desulfuromonadaceae bacterium]
MNLGRTGRLAFCILLASALLAACSASVPSWRNKAASLVEELGHRDAAPSLFPREYRSLLETFEHGEALYHVREDDKGADIYYQLAFQKAEILLSEIRNAKKKLAAERQQRIAELAAKAEEEQLMRAAAEAEIRMRAHQLATLAEAVQSPQKRPKDTPPPLPTSYTVRRGETLPQISARSEIYNDSSLWPIIYRANRDQIRDPKRLWPGQIFVIPRNFSHSEAVEARRFSSKK